MMKIRQDGTGGDEFGWARLLVVTGALAVRENQFPNRDCQRGALRCEMVSCDAMTSGFVSDLFTSSRSSGHR